MKLSLPVNAKLFLWQAGRLVSGRGTLQSTAVKLDILSPLEKDCPNKPAVFLPQQVDKITGVLIGSSIEQELRIATATRATHLPTIAYHIKNATLVGGSIYSGTLRHWIRGKKPRANPARHLQTAAVASTPQGTRWFGHWLMDDCLTYEIARGYKNVVCVHNFFSDQQRMYQTYFDQDWTETESATIDHLIIFDDLGQNSYKRQRHAKLSKAVQQRFRAPKTSNVYLRRGQSGTSRPIANEDEIIENLLKHGFILADIENDDLESVLAKLCNADLVVSVEGSHVSHCCYSLQEKAKLLLLQPSDRFCMIHSGWMGCIGARLGFVVGEQTEDGYLFPLVDILKTADLLMNRCDVVRLRSQEGISAKLV
jgi:hypothetical protein